MLSNGKRGEKGNLLCIAMGLVSMAACLNAPDDTQRLIYTECALMAVGIAPPVRVVANP